MVPSIVVTFTVALTFSRGALLGMFAGCVLILLLANAGRLAAVFAAASAAILAILVLIAPERTLTFLGGGSGSLRLELWTSSVRMIRDHPVTGVGPDQFLYQYLPRYVSPEAWPERFTSHPHNLILDAWLSLGIIGMVVLGVICTLVVQRMREAIATHDRITLASAGALITAVTHGMVDHGYFLPELAMSLWLLVILLRPAPDLQVSEKRPASVSESEG
jgi:O-antigen ligase